MNLFPYPFLFSFQQAQNKTDNSLAALKQIEIKTEEDLEDFTVEIDILTECKHANIVGLYEAFLHSDRLWVSHWMRYMYFVVVMYFVVLFYLVIWQKELNIYFEHGWSYAVAKFSGTMNLLQ